MHSGCAHGWRRRKVGLTSAPAERAPMGWRALRGAGAGSLHSIMSSKNLKVLKLEGLGLCLGFTIHKTWF